MCLLVFPSPDRLSQSNWVSGELWFFSPSQNNILPRWLQLRRLCAPGRRWCMAESSADGGRAQRVSQSDQMELGYIVFTAVKLLFSSKLSYCLWTFRGSMNCTAGTLHPRPVGGGVCTHYHLHVCLPLWVCHIWVDLNPLWKRVTSLNNIVINTVLYTLLCMNIT